MIKQDSIAPVVANVEAVADKLAMDGHFDMSGAVLAARQVIRALWTELERTRQELELAKDELEKAIPDPEPLV